MPYYICPNCRERSIDHDRREDLTNEAVGCHHCGFGFLFELMEDYYPGPSTAFVVCDQERRVLAAGRGLFELTGFPESALIGREVTDALTIESENGTDQAQLAVEWGVRRLDQHVTIRTSTGATKQMTADFFPAYDEDGGLLVALTPRA
jgi:PAS domain-containing protein